MRPTLPLDMSAHADRLRLRAAMGLMGALLAVVVAAAGAPAAHAEFSEALRQPCTGAPVQGE